MALVLKGGCSPRLPTATARNPRLKLPKKSGRPLSVEIRGAAKTALLALNEQFRAAGVSVVCAASNGYGDEGTIENIEFLNAEGHRVPTMQAGQFPKIEENFSTLLPGGYDQNEGSSGMLDVEQGCITVDVDWNVSTTENENYQV
ncbi:MAG: hypothetical protein ACRD3O_05285 [Terriglobia bacterium]